MTPEEKIAYNLKKKEYRKNVSEYQKQKYLEYCRKRYNVLTPEKKAELFEKRKAYYHANREKKDSVKSAVSGSTANNPARIRTRKKTSPKMFMKLPITPNMREPTPSVVA